MIRRLFRWLFRRNKRIETGVAELDAIMAGGIPADKLSTFYGVAGPKPGWHREDCPRVGVSWNPDKEQNPCECLHFGEGPFVCTQQDGTVK
jgi:hypothetical protein